MPHLTLEITANLRPRLADAGVLEAAHGALLASGAFEGPDVKSRLLWLEEFRVGRAGSTEAFLRYRVPLAPSLCAA